MYCLPHFLQSISLSIAKNAANSTLGTPSAISTNALGNIAAPFLNYSHFPNPTPVSKHFNQADHSINDVLLIPLELIRSNLP